jgi:hypothetical protein
MILDFVKSWFLCWSLGDGNYLLWNCKFVQGLNKIEFRAFAWCWFLSNQLSIFLEGFSFTFNFNDIPLSMYYVYFFSHVFYVFLLNIVYIMHFGTWVLNALSVFMCVLVSTILCLLLGLEIPFSTFWLRSSVGLEVCCVHCDSFIVCESWRVRTWTMDLKLQGSSFIIFIILSPKSLICGSTFTIFFGKLSH